jgi:vancomycin resistance protein YoaR
VISEGDLHPTMGAPVVDSPAGGGQATGGTAVGGPAVGGPAAVGSPAAVGPAIVTGSIAWRRLAGGFVIGLAASLALAGVALLAVDSQYDGRILPGVRVDRVDLSGLDRAGAAAALAPISDAFGDGRVSIRTVAPTVPITFAAFGRRADVDATIDEAMRAGRSGTVLERAVEEVRLALWGRRLDPRIVLDADALAGAVRWTLGRLERAPTNATISLRGDRIVMAPSRAGRTFDVEAVQAAVLEAVGRIDAGTTVVVEATASAVRPAHDDAEILAAGMAAERMSGPLVVTRSKETWEIPASTIRGWIRFVRAPGESIAPTVDAAAVARSLAPIATEVNKKPVSASFLVSRSGKVVGSKAGKNGRTLDIDATVSAIASEVAARAGGAAPQRVAVAVIAVEPKLTTDEARKAAPLMVRLGSWKTWFPIGERNYWGANIWLPAQLINGTVLNPGQRFEWWRAISPVTRARGFGMGGYIAGDHTEPTGALGGGMCSSSTTLFNAALRAGLQMGARDNHRYYINRYPLGLDATVSNSQTMSFTNDMDTPILIRGIKTRSGGRGWVRYEIWGIPDGRRVSIGRPVVRNFQKATTKVVYVTTRPPGQREQTEYASNGMDVSVARVVRDRNGRIIHRETYRSHYQRWDGRIEVGR